MRINNRFWVIYSMSFCLFLSFFILTGHAQEETAIGEELPVVPEEIRAPDMAPSVISAAPTAGAKDVSKESTPISIASFPASTAASSANESSDSVDIYFDNTDIRDVIEIIAAKAKMNMIVSEQSKANVTLKLEKVPWQTALDLILRTYNLTYKKEANLIRVMTLTEAEEEEKKVPMVTKIITLNFAQTDEISASLMKLLSARGSIQVNARTNSLIITDVPDKLAVIEETAKLLDAPTPQVMIETLILDVTLADEDELGVDWEALQVRKHQDMANTNDYTLMTDQPKIVDLSQPISQITNATFQVAVQQKLGWYDLAYTIRAWVQNRKAKVLASPKILTLDNQEAKIEIISQVPYNQANSSTEGGATTGTAFKDIGTRLSVTAHVTKDGHITMKLKPEQDINAGTEPVTQVPIVDTRRAETNVLVKDGDTVIIGGLRRVDVNETIAKVPILGDIPFIGNIFKKTIKDKTDVELMMFVTPHIIKENKLTTEEMQRYQQNLPLPQSPYDTRPVDIKEKFALRPPKARVETK